MTNKIIDEARRRRSAGFATGYKEAEKEFYSSAEPEYINAFAPGTDEHRGYEEAVYDFTQK